MYFLVLYNNQAQYFLRLTVIGWQCIIL